MSTSNFEQNMSAYNSRLSNAQAAGSRISDIMTQQPSDAIRTIANEILPPIAIHQFTKGVSQMRKVGQATKQGLDGVKSSAQESAMTNSRNISDSMNDLAPDSSGLGQASDFDNAAQFIQPGSGPGSIDIDAIASDADVRPANLVLKGRFNQLTNDAQARVKANYAADDGVVRSGEGELDGGKLSTADYQVNLGTMQDNIEAEEQAGNIKGAADARLGYDFDNDPLDLDADTGAFGRMGASTSAGTTSENVAAGTIDAQTVADSAAQTANAGEDIASAGAALAGDTGAISGAAAGALETTETTLLATAPETEGFGAIAAGALAVGGAIASILIPHHKNKAPPPPPPPLNLGHPSFNAGISVD